MIKGITNKEYDEWLKYCDYVQASTSHKLHESKHEREARVAHLLAPGNYGELFYYYFPHWCDDGQSKCSKYQVKNANTLLTNQKITLLQLHHRGSAKSTHANMGYPFYLMVQNELNYGLVMGYNEPKAARLLKDLQGELMRNQKIINDFGEQFSRGDWAKGRFSTVNGQAFESLSYIQDPAGLRNGSHRVDYANVDDVENLKKARNQVLMKEATKNVTSNLRAAMSKDTRRMVISNNYKIKNGLIDHVIAKIGKKKRTRISLVNAVDKNGNPTWPERYTKQYWKEMKEEEVDWWEWEQEYMNNPVEEGHLFLDEHMQYIDPLPYDQYNELIVYGDLSYTDTGDLKSLHLIGRTGKNFHILEAHNRRCSNTEAAKWLYDLYEEKLQGLNVTYMIEANFIQEMFLNDFDQEGEIRGYYLNILPDKRSKGNKFDRIENNLRPYFMRLRVFLNAKQKKSPDFVTLVDCLLAFEKGSGAPDDPPDSLEGGFYELARRAVNNIDRIRLIKTNNNFID